MAQIPSPFEDAWRNSPQESIDVVRLQGETNTQFAELRGDVKAGFAQTDAAIRGIRWVWALAIPVTIALTILIIGVIALVFQVVFP